MNFGNHVATVVTYEPTGNYNIQRFAGLFTQTNNRGLGFGDMNFSNSYVVGDIRAPTSAIRWRTCSTARTANSARHSTSTGTAWATTAICSCWGTNWLSPGQARPSSILTPICCCKRGDLNSSGTTDAADMAALYGSFGSPSWLTDLNVDGAVNIADVQTMITNLVRTVPGDFNLDGSVDAADYVVWRKVRGHERCDVRAG